MLTHISAQNCQSEHLIAQKNLLLESLHCQHTLDWRTFRSLGRNTNYFPASSCCQKVLLNAGNASSEHSEKIVAKQYNIQPANKNNICSNNFLEEITKVFLDGHLFNIIFMHVSPQNFQKSNLIAQKNLLLESLHLSKYFWRF